MRIIVCSDHTTQPLVVCWAYLWGVEEGGELEECDDEIIKHFFQLIVSSGRGTWWEGREGGGREGGVREWKNAG